MNLRPLAEPLGAGSVILYRRISGWITAPGTDGDRRAPLKRLGTLGFAGYITVASDYTSYALYAGTAAWIAGALMYGARPEPEATEATDEPDPPHGQPEADIPAAVRAAGTHKGAHLTAIARHLAFVTGQAWTSSDVRAACTAAGVPVASSVRMGAHGVSTGVRLKDLPSPPPAPAHGTGAGVVPAGQDPATATATHSATGPGDTGFVIVPDAENPCRHHVISTRKETP